MNDLTMATDIAGRVRNISLPATRPLMPLYEAVVNGIQAIEDANETHGVIEIVVLRDKTQLAIGDDRSNADIVGFRVTDNGVGFTDENFRSFWTSDSKYKAVRGGKGIGRFLWLVAFTRVEVDSSYYVQKKLVHRRFAFSESSNKPVELEAAAEPAAALRTIVELRGFREKYRKQCPKRLETIAAAIIEHCLEYFIRSNCPQITIRDDADGNEINLNNMFASDMQAKQEITEFKVAGQKLLALHLRLNTAHAREHLIHFCARDRVVRSEKLLGKLPDPARIWCGRNLADVAAYEASLIVRCACRPLRNTNGCRTGCCNQLVNGSYCNSFPLQC